MTSSYASVVKIAAFIIVFLAACSAPEGQKTTPPTSPDTIFIGDNIISMDGSEITAVAITKDRITATGSSEDLLETKGELTRIVELGDRALLPGFIDAHGHIAMQARILNYVNLSSPPVGPVENIGDLQRLLRDYITENEIPSGQWVIGYGYDDSLLAEQRHPTRDDLDEVTTDHPIFVIHVSAHLAVLNSAGLVERSIDMDTPDPSGGVIRRRQGTQTPNGVLEETAAQSIMIELLMADRTGFSEKVRAALLLYASYGITTAQDGGTSLLDVNETRQSAVQEPLPIDLVSYLHIGLLNAEQQAALKADEYAGGFRVGGVKFVLDGSIQAKTGYLADPYLLVPEGQSQDYRGYPMMQPETYNQLVAPFLKRGVPVLTHANGDAAIEMMLDGVEQALEGSDVSDHRTVIIHALMARDDQLDRAAKLGVMPSFYSVHPYFWGDWHRQLLGEERADRISPTRSALSRNIPITIHNDSPVVPPDMMRLLWITVNRETRSGDILGPDQRLTVMEALYAMTQGAAYQYFEEETKGSITPGKQADLVILSENPLLIDPSRLKDIEIVETIARGKTVFQQASSD